MWIYRCLVTSFLASGNKNMEDAVMIGGRGLEVTGYTSDQDRINQSRNTLLFLISLGMLRVVNKNYVDVGH